jgi:hypothetical protein
MNIKPQLYEALTARQRVSAVLQAESRQDWAEVGRLRRTTPKVVYKMFDAEVVDTLEKIHFTAVCFDLELSNLTIDWMSAVINSEDQQRALQNIANMFEARTQFMGRLGVPREIAENYGAPPHRLTITALALAPPPEPEKVAELLMIVEEASQ